MAVKTKPAPQRQISPMSTGERLSILEDMIKHPERYLPKSISDMPMGAEKELTYRSWRTQTQVAYNSLINS